MKFVSFSKTTFFCGLVAVVVLLGGLFPGLMTLQDKEYASPEGPLAEIGYENIKTFPTDTGVYAYGARSTTDETCFFMIQSNNGWMISQKLHKRKLSLPYPMNEMVGSFYQAENEKLSLVHIQTNGDYQSELAYPTELTDTAGMKYDLLFANGFWTSGPAYHAFCQYMGLGNIHAKEGYTILKGENHNVDYEEGVYYDKNWHDTIGSYSGNIVPTAECAVNLASVIFSSIPQFAVDAHMTPNSVFWDIEDGVWIVTFWDSSKDNENEVYIGYCINIAIQASDGKVLRLWAGE
jgi:hypothetical protein